METQTTIKEFLSPSFLGTLKDNPYRWFIDIPSSFITSFVDLILKFVTQHINNIRIKKSSNILMSIKQGSDDICHYTKKFMESMTKISDLKSEDPL